MKNIGESTPLERRVARVFAGEYWMARPVEVVEGRSPPELIGDSYYFTTPSGNTRVHHPGAYKWPTRYWPSTKRIEVGRKWLDEVAPLFEGKSLAEIEKAAAMAERV